MENFGNPCIRESEESAPVHSNCAVKQTMISSSLVLLLAVISCKFSLLSVWSLNLLIKSLLTVFKLLAFLRTGIIWFDTGIDSYELTQPESLTVRPDATLTINCKVSYSVTSSSTAWIRQPAGKALEWIGLIWSSGGLAYKDSLKSKFSITRDTSSNTITLQGKNMQAEDTAVYYCAKDTQWQTPTAFLLKNTIIVLQIKSVFDDFPHSDLYRCTEIVWSLSKNYRH